MNGRLRMTIAESLKKAEAVLAASDVAQPRREAASLMMLATGKDKGFFYAHPEHVLEADDITRFDAFIARRANREPLQHISGVQEFYGLEFEVTPDVLIPRPETEMVVEHALALIRNSDNGAFCDVGTGTGCIAISILHELSAIEATALDISIEALRVAERNARKHGVNSRLKLLESDLFSALTTEKFELIVSNPPYIPSRDMNELQAEVRDFEPYGALTDGSDGLSIIRRIVAGSQRFLAPNGHLILEIGIGQSESALAMFDSMLWIPPEVFADLQGIPRLVSARLI